MNKPEIVSVGIVWDSERPTLEHIMDVFATVGTSLKLGEVFHSVVDNRWSDTTIHNLVGVVTYYGKHYSTFFFHTKLRVWIYFDDATVREVGPRWEQVVEKCRKGRYQPLLLLYAVPSGTPVNTENAPKQITTLYTERSLNKKHPSQSLLRRSVTPSPEKPIVGNTRRAITPNPDGSLNQQTSATPHYNEYQNLSVIQSNLYGTKMSNGTDVVDCGRRFPSDYGVRKSLDSMLSVVQKAQVSIQRTHSSGSSSGVDMSGPENTGITRRRDSGNWSGDRNSASSSSSTTMENPYLYLVGKVPFGNGSLPGSPTRVKCDSSSGSSCIYDAGYDSYSLSSNDSSTMTTIQHLMKMGHLAKIPEDYGNVSTTTSPSCDVLCDEADELLVKSRQLEDEHDLVLALALCNAAATKARAAMNAPYNNPQTLTLARMKHNTCIMRARSLHRRMTQTQTLPDNPPEIRHTREGSSGSGRHSRQNSRDKTLHSRQNSRELLSQPQPENVQPQISKKSIEIYATLPKKKDGLKSKAVNISIEDEEYMLYDKQQPRESRSIFSRSKNKEANKVREKRSRSEDRNKMSKDFSIAPEIVTLDKSSTKKDKVKEEDKKEKDGKGKKQHKIRRKLLMGGLIRRKNRSMPDLTEASDPEKGLDKPVQSVDDSRLGMKEPENLSSMCGYLSEGHLEFSGCNGNPNLERSRLMRKSFHGSAGKVLAVAKVPPPPPLRTTSQLTSKPNTNGVSEMGNHYLPTNSNDKLYQKVQNYGTGGPNYYNSMNYNLPSHNSEFIRNNVVRPQENHYDTAANEMYDSRTPTNFNTVVTQADVHQEQSPAKKEYLNSSNSIPDTANEGVDEVDCMPQRYSPPNLDLPPYPSPVNSAMHSRQPSEDFPPPPPPLDLSALDEHINVSNIFPQTISNNLANLQDKHVVKENSSSKNSGGTWLNELQAKQAALRKKNQEDCNADVGVDEVNTQRITEQKDDLSKITSVKDLASKFENIRVNPAQTVEARLPGSYVNEKIQQHSYVTNNHAQQSENVVPDQKNCNNLSNAVNSSKERHENNALIAPEQIAEEIREVEMLNAVVQKTLNCVNEDDIMKKHKAGKKKSVSFCDQVILVATAEEQEDDSYIPNPILERVLRSAMNKPETAAIRQEIMTLREAEKRKDEKQMLNNNCQPQEQTNLYNAQTLPNELEEPYQPLHVRHNSVENILTSENIANPVQNAIVQNQHETYSGTTHDNHNVIVQEHCRAQQNYNPVVQYNSHIQHRQSPYQHTQLPYNQVNTQNRPATAHPPLNQHNNQIYGYEHNLQANQFLPNSRVQPFNHMPHVQNPVRHSPTPAQYSYASNGQPYLPQHQQVGHPVYQHPPSPAPSNVSYSNGAYHPHNQNNMYAQQVQTNCVQSVRPQTQQYSPYQRVPHPVEQNNMPVYQRVPYTEHSQQQLGCVPPPQNGYVHSNPNVNNPSPYQRVPNPDMSYYQGEPNNREPVTEMYHQQPPSSAYSPYQQALQPKQMAKKTVSFEAGTKGGVEMQRSIVMPIKVNNNISSSSNLKSKCNLCRKKHVVTSNSYCTDCEFYMSRFKPKN